MTAFNLKPGESAQVVSVSAYGSLAARLGALGIRNGSIVTAVGFSLFRGAILLVSGGARVGLRKSLAERIEVQPC